MIRRVYRRPGSANLIKETQRDVIFQRTKEEEAFARWQARDVLERNRRSLAAIEEIIPMIS